MNKHGSGIAHYEEVRNPEMTLFSGGLRAPNILHTNRLLEPRNQHDKLSYARGIIQHSRSPATQYQNFHFMYGGIQKYVFQRFFYQVMYKRILRATFVPTFLLVSCELTSPGHHHENV